jgi:hypothetical protein
MCNTYGRRHRPRDPARAGATKPLHLIPICEGELQAVVKRSYDVPGAVSTGRTAANTPNVIAASRT